MSSLPNRSTAAAIMRPLSAPDETSAARKSPPISRAVRSPATGSRSASTSRAPSSAKRPAISAPKPDAAPVTIATFPARRLMRRRSRWRSELQRIFPDYQIGSGGGSNLVDRRIRGDLSQNQTPVRHLDHGQLGNDQIDDLQAGERQRAPLQDLVAAILRRVLHRDDDLLRAGHEIHRAAHALD